MWKTPIAMFSSGGVINFCATSDTLIGNLWTFLGSPSSKQTVTFCVDGADVGNIIVTGDWATGSTFQFQAINGGRFLGLGGGGGNGGNDLGANGTRGFSGGGGGSAIFTVSPINIDVDDGYLYGGGGGGGGGAYHFTSPNGTPGGGGGGGAGFATTVGGTKGNALGVPIAVDGNDGGPAGNGSGGNGGTVGTNDGMPGGIWGAGGQSGRSTNMTGTNGQLQLYCGLGGRAGQAVGIQSGTATPTFNGAKTEATLRSENRIKGDAEFTAAVLADTNSSFASVNGASTHGWQFANNGNLIRVNSDAGNTTFTDQWTQRTLTDIGDGYDIRERALVGDTDGTWDNTPGAAGTWFALTAPRQWDITDTSGIVHAASLIEIRRNDLPAGASDNEITDSCIISSVDENGV